MHFGATLRLLRTNAGWTLRELAERLGVSNTYLSRVENGHDAPPTPDRLADLAGILGLPAGKLIELADSVAPTASTYLARVPAARDLLLEIVRRELGPVDLARVRAFVEREFPIASSKQGHALSRMLAPERVVLQVACSQLDDVVDIAAAKLAPRPASVAKLADGIRSRERDCSSALGGGLAVPYQIVNDAPPALTVVTLRWPLHISTPDGLPIRLALVHTHHGPPEHTLLLARLADLADESKVSAICSQRNTQGVVRMLRKFLAT
jgi:PTS system nitrogen regulatory IIA component